MSTKVAREQSKCGIFDQAFFCGLAFTEACGHMYTHAATKQLKTSLSKGEALVSWFSQNVKCQNLILTLKATLTEYGNNPNM